MPGNLFEPLFVATGEADSLRLSGAKLYFYATGTATPKNTYSDSALSVANSNPVVADSNGEFGAIYLLSDGAYKVTLTDASDVTMQEYDPVDARVSSTTAATLAGTAATTGLSASSGVLSLAINSLTEDTSPDATNDFVATYDASAMGLKKVAPTRLLQLPFGYIYGFRLGNNSSDSDHDIDITAGSARGADDDEDIKTSSTLVKRADASWVTGSGNGGLSSSLSLASDTLYHVHAIVVGGTADIGFDTSITAANLVADHSATAYRRIGSFWTDGSANVIPFLATGAGAERVYEFTGPDGIALSLDSTAVGATAASVTLKVPTGLKVDAIANVIVVKASTGASVLISDPDQDDEAPSTSAAPLSNVGNVGDGNTVSYQMRLMTNTSGQWRVRSTAASTTLRIATIGWRDFL